MIIQKSENKINKDFKQNLKYKINECISKIYK